MTRRKTSLFILAGYLLGVAVTGIIRGKIVLLADWLDVTGLFVGGVLGWLLVNLDRLVYVYFSHAGTQMAQYARYQFDQKKWREGWRIFEMRQDEMEELTFRSALFQAAWVVLALFALTSTASLFGKSLVMGVGLKILVDEWRDYLYARGTLKRWLFWQVKRQITDTEVKVYLYVMTAAFLLLTLLLL